MAASVKTLSQNAPSRLTVPGRSLKHAATSRERANQKTDVNVGNGERMVSTAAGAILILQGLARRDLLGLITAGVGGALAYRGASGHCAMYESLGIDTASDSDRARESESHGGTRVALSQLIDKPPEELYSYWRNFENLPKIMRHLESVRVMDDRRSHWIAKAPRIAGGQVEWDAEITADEPNSRIAWRSLPDGDVEHRGSVTFARAPGDRGTKVRVELDYDPPAGTVGRWIAKIFGEEPEQQIHEDLRNFKRTMEVGEVITVVGQPHGTCTGRGKRTAE